MTPMTTDTTNEVPTTLVATTAAEPAPQMDNLLDFEPIPDYGDVMTFSEWIAAVREGVFVDDDGVGYWATDSAMSREEAVPSQLGSPEIAAPAWATRVVWFNK